MRPLPCQSMIWTPKIRVSGLTLKSSRTKEWIRTLIQHLQPEKINMEHSQLKDAFKTAAEETFGYDSLHKQNYWFDEKCYQQSDGTISGATHKSQTRHIPWGPYSERLLNARRQSPHVEGVEVVQALFPPLPLEEVKDTLKTFTNNKAPDMNRIPGDLSKTRSVGMAT